MCHGSKNWEQKIVWKFLYIRYICLYSCMHPFLKLVHLHVYIYTISSFSHCRNNLISFKAGACHNVPTCYEVISMQLRICLLAHQILWLYGMWQYNVNVLFYSVLFLTDISIGQENGCKCVHKTIRCVGTAMEQNGSRGTEQFIGV